MTRWVMHGAGLCLVLMVGACGSSGSGKSSDGMGTSPSPRVQAIGDGLTWLASHQAVSGDWDLANFQKECGHNNRKGKCDGFGLSEYNVGTTGLCLLAFIEAGHNHMRSGPWRKAVKNGAEFLKKSQKSNGAFGKETDSNFTYNQALATNALARLWLVSGDHRLKQPVRRAIDWLLQAQNGLSQGGAWRYANYKANPALIREHLASGGGINDTSVTALVSFALLSAREAGLEIPAEAFAGVRHWLDSVSEEGKTYGYTKKLGFVRGRKFATTALAFVLEREVFSLEPPHLAVIQEELPTWSGVQDLYFWYAGTRALVGLDTPLASAWNAAVTEALLSGRQQKPGLDLNGSWDPSQTCWGGDYGGRVYSTALAVLTLAILDSSAVN